MSAAAPGIPVIRGKAWDEGKNGLRREREGKSVQSQFVFYRGYQEHTCAYC